MDGWMEGPLTSVAYGWRLERADGVTLGFTSHDADVARFAERVLRFRDGRLKADETQNAADAATALVALPEADAVA